MKINEVTTPLKHFTATVRVVTGSGSTTARTSVTADTQQQARAILSRLYGAGNVISISEVMHEAPETDQIQRRETIPASAIRRQHPRAKRGPVQLSCVAETEGTKTLSPAELQVKSLADKADDYKRQEKQLKARQALAKAQQKLRSASAAPKMSF